MVKQEIKNFKIEYGDIAIEGRTLPLCCPTDAGAQWDSEKALVLSSGIYIDHMTSTYKHVYLRISDTVGGYEVTVNGTPVGSSDGAKTLCFFDIREAVHQGDNDIVISFFAGTRGAGIFGGVDILKFGGAVIDNVSVSEKHEGGCVSVSVRLDTVGTSEGVRAVATLVSSAGQIYYGGIIRGKGTITVRDPLYWWPRGQGIQNLYKLTVNLYGETEIEDTREMFIGLRKITTVNSADGGLMDANGAQFVPMGALYRPIERGCDALADRRLLEAQVASMARANFNTVVIPEGAMRPSDHFYSLCDSHGIIVVHEAHGIDDSLRDSLMRNSHHASFGMIDFVGCGDDIVELSDLLREIDPDSDFALYEDGVKYVGAESLPAKKTLFAMLPEGERNLFSEKLEVEGRDKILGMISMASESYPYAGNLEDFAYLSGLCAAERLSREMVRARLDRGDSGRAVFSEISSDSALISQSVIDSSAVWKAPLYYAESFFAPLAVFAEICDTGVAFSVSNESRRGFVGKIEYKIIDNHNSVIHSEERDCDVPKFSAKRLFIRDLSEYISGHEREYYLEYCLRDGSSVISKRTLLFCEPKRFALLDPKIKAEVAGDDRRFGVTLSAESFAKGVEIRFEDAAVFLSDNFIDVTSSAPVKVSVTLLSGYESAKSLAAKMKIKTLYDIGK